MKALLSVFLPVFLGITGWEAFQQERTEGKLIVSEVSLHDPEICCDYFIALIHPIQWTIAKPVGADQPTKHQKKTSCVSTGRPLPSTSALARWRVVLPSCLDSVRS